MKKLLLVLATVFLGPAITFANGNHEHMGDWGHMMAGGMFMWIIFLIIIAVVILLIVQGTKSTSSGSSSRESFVNSVPLFLLSFAQINTPVLPIFVIVAY